MQLLPGYYLRTIAGMGLGAWALLRAAIAVPSVMAGLRDPLNLSLSTEIALLGLVPAVTWLSLRRRNLGVLLPNLGFSVAAALTVATATAAVAEATTALVLR